MPGVLTANSRHASERRPTAGYGGLLFGGESAGLSPRRWRLVESSVLHDREEAVSVLKDLDVLRRIPVDQNEVGKKSRLHLAEFVAAHHDLTAEPGRRNDRLHRRIVEQVDEMLEVAR